VLSDKLAELGLKKSTPDLKENNYMMDKNFNNPFILKEVSIRRLSTDF